MKRCDNCIYWNQLNSLTGECRYKPPVLKVPSAPISAVAFPVTEADMWCGEGRFKDGDSDVLYDFLGSQVQSLK